MPSQGTADSRCVHLKALTGIEVRADIKQKGHKRKGKDGTYYVNRDYQIFTFNIDGKDIHTVYCYKKAREFALGFKFGKLQAELEQEGKIQ